MTRKLLIAAAVFLLVVAGVAVFLYNSIDSIVKTAIERFGSDITGTEVSVASVDISLKSGRGTIRGLRVDNPEGFSSHDALELGEVTLDIDVASLNKDPIVIEEIRVMAPAVRAELDEKARSNIGVIKDHAEGYQAGAAQPKTDKRDSGFEKHFVIRKVTFEEGKIAADATAVGQGEKDIDLPAVRLTDVGGSRGATPAAIGKTITRAFLGQVMDAVADELKAEARKKLEDEAQKKLGEIIR
jgi:uncharacterized protein involved in outer membrane biogenesis